MIRPIAVTFVWPALLLSTTTHGQNYPVKPIRIIAPFATGGSSDLVARTAAQKLAEHLGVSVVVENRTGAGGSIGAELVAKSPADGYTLLLASVSVLSINSALYGAKLPFNPERDFAPISLLIKSPLTISVHPSVPARTIKEFIALAKARPGKMNYGSSGNGTSFAM